MRMRTKLVFAEMPLVVAVIVIAVVGSTVMRDLARSSDNILKDNYRSVLAAQRIKESAERIDSGIVFTLIGRSQVGLAQVDANVPKLEDELRVQEGNITEPGERDATAQLRTAWDAYRAAARREDFTPDRYFATLLPRFLAVKNAAQVILELNQDAMMHKSGRAQTFASDANTLLVVVSITGLALALIGSSVLTTRILRPLGVLGQTARRLGEGDLAVRARVITNDEIGALAREVNTMAERLQKYRESSLGDLVEAQVAAQATIDSLPDPVLVIGLDGELRQANQAAETLLKAHVEAGMGALAALEPAARSAVERVRQHIAGGHGPYVPKGLDEAVRVTTANGDRLLSVRGAPFYAEEGDVAGATIVLQDVTRQHRFEELRNDLVATVAHELRTPLTSLRMAVHMLSEQVVGPLTAKQADLVYAAREDCERLQSIVDELLDLSRIQADRIELRISEQDPEYLVTEAIDDQESAASARGVTLRSEVLPGTPAVAVDVERIQLVLANLLGNAIRYGPAHGIVTVRARRIDGSLRLEVHDEGPGIPEEFRQAIFEKYVRVPGVPPGGAGLGLFISREIVRAHAGEIGVESAPDKGTTFWFTVPIAETR